MTQHTDVIHDLGYRGYQGPREGTGALLRTLYLTGLRHAFGLGRSGKSKVLPFVLLGINLLPAVIIVGFVVLTGMNSLPLSYSAYVSQLQMVISLFAAAQAPVLFSRDLRHRSIVLYLARPLPPGLFAVTRWASLASAVLVFTLLPTALLYAGALLAGLDFGDETPALLRALVLQLLLAGLLAGVTGVISSLALRRGFAVVLSIIVLIAGTGVAIIFQQIASVEGIDHVGEIAGLFSPWTLHGELADFWNDRASAFLDVWWSVGYLVVMVGASALCLAALAARFARVGAR